jgi:glyoxylase-like metal-dependent hydrolase (beta-lactamase superfamily II)
LGPPPSRLPLLPDPVELVAPGQELDLGGVSLRFLAADGHAPYALLGLVPQEKVVFASDSAGWGTPRGPEYPMYFVSYHTYLQTLAGLARMEIEALGLGHQLCLRGDEVGPYLDLTARRLEADRQEIRRQHTQGLEPEELAQRLCDKHYHDELTIFSRESALAGCRLLVRRSIED